MRCQLEALSRDIAREYTLSERIMRRWDIFSRRAGEILRKALSPKAVIGKARTKLHLSPRTTIHLPQISASPTPTLAEETTEKLATGKKLPPLNLVANETVRIKSYDDICKTLDSQGRYEGCAFTAAMIQYCGQTTTVIKRIDRFFDERNWKLLKAKNIVILANVFCKSAPDLNLDWAGCDRSCYLFWKEAWLERPESGNKVS